MVSGLFVWENDMLTNTYAMNWRRVRRTNTTDNGFPSRIMRATAPSGKGDAAAQTTSAVFDLCQGEGSTHSAVVIKPYGAGADNATFSLRVIGWTKMIEDGGEDLSSWDPTVLCELLCTLSAVPIGLAGKTIVATDKFADTIALTTGNDDVSIDIVSPTGDVAAHAMLDLKGFQKIEVTFTTGASATNCNALIRFL